MRCAYKHPKLYSDLVCFYKSYWQVHSNLPRHFQAISGLLILHQLTACIEYASAANFTDAWELSFISHNVMAHLNDQLDTLGKKGHALGRLVCADS